MSKNCCSTDSERLHCCCQLPNEVWDIDRTHACYSFYLQQTGRCRRLIKTKSYPGAVPNFIRQKHWPLRLARMPGDEDLLQSFDVPGAIHRVLYVRESYLLNLWRPGLPLQLGGNPVPPNTWFRDPTWVHVPNGISIGSQKFIYTSLFTVQVETKTYTQTYYKKIEKKHKNTYLTNN